MKELEDIAVTIIGTRNKNNALEILNKLIELGYQNINDYEGKYEDGDFYFTTDNVIYQAVSSILDNDMYRNVKANELFKMNRDTDKYFVKAQISFYEVDEDFDEEAALKEMFTGQTFTHNSCQSGDDLDVFVSIEIHADKEKSLEDIASEILGDNVNDWWGIEDSKGNVIFEIEE